MNIVMIGSGNAAAILGRKFKAAGHTILQVYSRNARAASALAYEWDTESTNYKSLINAEADVYIIAVQDDAIATVVAGLQLPGKVVAHTAAAVPKEILGSVTEHAGVFYPLQSLRKERKELPEIPVFYDGSDEKSKRVLEQLARSISEEKVAEAGVDTRIKLHLAAVFVSNFVNHLYVLAEVYCRKEGLDFKDLQPLIDETALRLRTLSPSMAQTGPAFRDDKETLQKHLQALEYHPDLKQIYILLTESIQRHS